MQKNLNEAFDEVFVGFQSCCEFFIAFICYGVAHIDYRSVTFKMDTATRLA